MIFYIYLNLKSLLLNEVFLYDLRFKDLYEAIQILFTTILKPTFV